MYILKKHLSFQANPFQFYVCEVLQLPWWMLIKNYPLLIVFYLCY